MTKSKLVFKDLVKLELSRQRLLGSFIMLLSLIGIINAFRFGGASLDYYFVRNSIELWQKSGSVQKKGDYENAKRAINTASSVHSSHPLYIELVAQIKEWGSTSGFEPDLSLQTAKKNYLLATQIRPLWPVTWANLAMFKWRMQEFDEEMLYFLNRASELGPQKAEVNVLFTQLGLSLYDNNHPFFINIEKEVKNRLSKGLRNPNTSTQVLNFITQNEHTKTACRWMKLQDNFVYSRVLSCE